MTRRRLALATLGALAAAATLGAAGAAADPGVQTSSGDYIACIGLRVVPVATCIEEPIGPVLDQLPLR